MSLVSPKPGGQGEGGARGCLAPCGIPLGLPALLSTAVSLLLQVGEEGAQGLGELGQQPVQGHGERTGTPRRGVSTPRHRDGHRQTQTPISIWTHGQTHTWTHRQMQTDTHTDTQIDGHTDTYTDTQTCRHSHRHPCDTLAVTLELYTHTHLARMCPGVQTHT